MGRRMTAWRVYLGNRHLTTVFYTPGVTKEEVKRGLVEHDGYSPYIVVVEE